MACSYFWQSSLPSVPCAEDTREFGGVGEGSGDTIGSDEFFDKSLKRMQGAVRIPTESFDDMGPVGEDPRWDVFKEFHAYLEESFPLV
jgi:Gly-Xaa carboxypeptidase